MKAEDVQGARAAVATSGATAGSEAGSLLAARGATRAEVETSKAQTSTAVEECMAES